MLKQHTPGAIAERWMSIKREGDLRHQHQGVYRRLARPEFATGLIDLRALEGRGLPPFGSRDRTRGRTWVTPTMAAVLISAHRIFTSKHPGTKLTLGDLAQPGGGNLLHNVIVRDVKGPEALALLNAAHLQGGRWSVDHYGRAADFPGELGRFNSPEDEVWTHHVLHARHASKEGAVSLRTRTIRYTFPTRPDEDARTLAFGHFKRTARRGTLVQSQRVRETTPEGTLRTMWRQHWVDPQAKRQLITLSSREQKRRLRMSSVHSVRYAHWQQRKPGSLPKETHWRRAVDASPEAPWVRWQAMREAGHVTHMAGSDADISFVTHGNRRHFAVDVSALDARRTWEWFEALDEAAQRLGTEVDGILISRVIIRALERHLSKEEKRSRLWRSRIKRAGGHDAHHHLRLAPPNATSRARAAALLAALSEANEASPLESE